MLKKLLFSLLVTVFVIPSLWSQGFLSIEFLKHYTASDLALLAFNATSFNQGANAYKVTYTTSNLEGNDATVSGLLALPEDLGKRYPLACYQHGTSGSKDNVPSRLQLDYSIAVSLAGKGYVTVAPDLLGLGDDNMEIHPYVHAASEAWVAIDMMRAVREYAENNGVYLNDQVFISGYSQGGHSAMALHRHLEQNLDDEFHVTAAAPMSGPYSIAEVMNELIVSGEEYTRPAYLINTFISYQRVYGNIYPDIATAFRAPYRQLLEDFSNNLLGLSDLDVALTDSLNQIEGAVIPIKILEDAYIAAVINDPDHPMVLAMKENNVYDWAPNAPTRLYYCQADEQVPFENSLVAEGAMNANGAGDVVAINLSTFLDHFFCALPAAVATVDFFGTYQMVEDVALSVGEGAIYGLELFPNPTSGQLTLKNNPGEGDLFILDMDGKVKLEQHILQGDNLLSLNGLPSGIYTVKVVNQAYIKSQKLVVK